MSKPTISLCMIVKNESRWLTQCLQSVGDWVDEMIVVDTGSTDDTAEIARNMGALVHYFAWEDDFSKARNFSLSKATSDWILVLDADEVMSQQDKDQITTLICDSKTPMYHLVQTTYCEESATFGWIPNNLNLVESQGYPGYLESPLARLFKNTPDIYFDGCIHEHAQHKDSKIKSAMTGIRIHHYGKYTAKEALAKKEDLYLKLGIEKCRSRPDDAYAWYELGVQYWGMGQEDDALEAFTKSEKLDPNYVRTLVALGGITTSKKAYPKALRYYSRVMDVDPRNIIPYLYLPTILIEMGNIKLAQEILRYGQRFASEHPPFHINRGIVQQNVGNHRLAIECFDDALKINPSEYLALYNKGISYSALDEITLADKNFRRVMDNEKIGLLARKKLIELLYKSDRLVEAKETLTQTEQIYGPDMELHYQKSVLHLKSGDKEAARLAISQVTDFSTFDLAGLSNFKTCLMLLGDTGRVGEIEALMVSKASTGLKGNRSLNNGGNYVV